MIVSMGKAVYEVCPEALEKGQFKIIRVICSDITKNKSKISFTHYKEE